MRRKLGIAAGLIALALVVGAAVAWLVWVPSAIEARVAEAAERRGLQATVAGVDAGWSGVELRTVELTGRDALTIRLDHVRLNAGVLELASEGRAAVSRVEVDGVRVAVDVSSGQLESVLAGLRGASAESGSSARRSDRPVIDVGGVDVEIRDGQGPLLSVSDAEAHLLEGDIVRLVAGEVALAPGEDEGGRAQSIEARVHRERETGWRIDSLIVRDASLRYREREPSEDSPVWDRVRVAARSLRAIVDAELGQDDESTADDDEPPEAEEGEGTEHESRLALIARAADAVGPRLSEGASLRLEGLDVVSRSDAGEQHVLRGLVAEARKLSDRRYRLEGEGRPGQGGELRWNLTVEPDALRAEGDVSFERLPFVLLVPFLPDLPWYRPEETNLSGDLTIRGDSASEVHLEGQARVDDLALSSERIAPTPVRNVDASFSGEASWLPLSRRLEIPRATVGLGDAQAELSGSLEWPEDHFLVDVRATLPPTDCNTAVGAIPADLLAETNGFTFRGSIGGRVTAHVDSRDLDATELDVRIADGCTFVTVPSVADVGRFSSAFVHHVVEPDGTQFTMETGPDTLSWTPISQISPFLVQAVLGHEDGGFFRHSGFSVPSIRLALIRNLREGRYVYGASTITMQLVKNVFLHREKTLARKVQEVLLTWWVESAMEKSAILELYLNVIEYGPEVYGIRDAAMHYFGRSPALLGPAESAYLATILPNPKAFHSHWEDNELPDRHRRRLARFVRTLGSRERYDERAVEYALSRLEDFRFHRPGDPVSLPDEDRGSTGELPFATALGVPQPWDEDVPEDVPFDDEFPDEEESW